MKLKDKVAFITGGGSGIGKATSILLAKEGAKVVVSGRTGDELEKVCAEIKNSGGEAIPVAADISLPEEMKNAVETIIIKWGRIDIVFANAGINGVWAPLEEIAYEEWQKTININLTGTYLTIKSALPYLKKQGGSIIITSSVNGTRMFSNTGATAYACTKAAQAAMAKMLAVEFGQYKIRINAIMPGSIKTNIDENTEKRDIDKVKPEVEYKEGKIPLTGGEPGSPAQVAKLVLFLASSDSDHITGTEVWIDGAQSLLVG